MSKGRFNSAAFVALSGVAQIASGALVEVRKESDNLLATLYLDDAGTAWPNGNPFPADNEGRFAFHADGRALGYKITITKGAVSTILRQVPIGELMYYDISSFPVLTDPELLAISGLVSAADRGIVFTGLGTASLFTLTAFARTYLDDADQPSTRTTLGVGTGDSPSFAQINLAGDPGSALQAATKQYVDNAIAGLDPKQSCRLATTANDTRSGLAARDGITPVGGDRVLVKNQTAPAENGIFIAAAGAWARSTDMDNWLEVPGALVAVELGTLNADTVWLGTADQGGTLNTTAITFSQFAVGSFQPLDADLTALAANASDGLWCHTGAGTGSARTLTAPAAGMTITNPAGIAGNPTFVLANDLLALEGLAANGIVTRTAADTMTVRTITGSTSVAVTQGDGVAGNPTIALSASHLPGRETLFFPASALTPRSANGCAVLATSNGAANQPDVPYLAFDGVVKEYAYFYARMPKSWNESTVTAAFSWRRASGTGAANVVWGIRALAVSDNDSPAAAFGSDATVTTAAKTTLANFAISAETGACTIAGSPAAEDLVFFEVFRDGAAGGDTLDTVDAWLSGLTLYFTVDAFNDA